MRSFGLCHAAALAALIAVAGRPAEVKADCQNPADDTVIAQPVGGALSGASFPHPVLEKTAVMAGMDFRLIDFEMKEADWVELAGSAEANPTIANLGTDEAPEYAAFVALKDGIVTRVNIDAESYEVTEAPTGNWPQRLPGKCTALIAAPVVHVRRYATPAFQAAYSGDVVYMATANVCDTTPDTKENRIFALDAASGDILWTFNESNSVDMDWVSESPVLDIQNDMLIVASDRRASPTQDSLWGIDVLTGTAAWSASVGRLLNAPVVLDDRIYVADYSGYIRALNREDGTVLWSNRVSYYGFTSNLFVEFRTPYRDLIAAADRFGNVVLATDDGGSGSKIWSTKLDAHASGPVGIDPENGKLYVGDVDGNLNQLSIIDGEVEARRLIDPTTSIGAATFTFSSAAFEEIVLMVGSSGGQFAKLCYPWTATAPTPAVGGGPRLARDACKMASDCGPRTVCGMWQCENTVCVPVPQNEGKECPAEATEVGVCRGGVCAPESTCDTEDGFYGCECVNDEGLAIKRWLLVAESELVKKPPEGRPPQDPKPDPITTPVSAVMTTNSCLTIGTKARTAVFAHLIDQHGRPFRGAEVTFSLERLAGGTLPVWRNPKDGTPIDGTKVFATKAERAGTYYAILGPPDDGEASGPEGFRISATVSEPECLAGHLALETTIFTAGPPGKGGGACDLLSDAGKSGFLEVWVTKSNDPVPGAIVTVGRAQDDKAFFSNYELFITTDGPGDSPNYGKTDEAGKIVFQDFGNKLNGPTVVTISLGNNETFTIPNVETAILPVDLDDLPRP